MMFGWLPRARNRIRERLAERRRRFDRTDGDLLHQFLHVAFESSVEARVSTCRSDARALSAVTLRSEKFGLKKVTGRRCADRLRLRQHDQARSGSTMLAD
jgi:hypothetical protein